MQLKGDYKYIREYRRYALLDNLEKINNREKMIIQIIPENE